jgi:hypothetical protein
MNRFSAGLKSSSPLLKQGAPTRFAVDDIGGLFSGSHADSKAPADLVSQQSRQGLLKSYAQRNRPRKEDNLVTTL